MPVNTSPVYPGAAEKSPADGEENPPGGRPSYFSPIPRAVWDLRREHKLTPRDIDVLGLLLDYKTSGTPLVDPEQTELAARLDCSTDTISRSLARLRRAGLIATHRRRDLRGRLGRMTCDLSAVLALMPARAAKLRSGQWGRSFGPRRPATPQNCGLPESGRDSVVVRNNAPGGEKIGPAAKKGRPAQEGGGPWGKEKRAVGDEREAPEDGETAAALQQAGVFAADALVARYGLERCRAALHASARVPLFRQSRAAWIVSALGHDWPLPPETAETRPRAHWQYRPAGVPTPARPAPDPLSALPPDLYATLETRARAELWDETRPACRETLLGRKNAAGVRARMRRLLAAQTEV